METQRSAVRWHLIAILVVVIWGSTYISSKVVLASFSAVQAMFVRLVIAYVTLLALHPKLRRPVWKDELLFLPIGFLGSSGYFLVTYAGLERTTAGNVSILVALAPILTAAIAHFFSKDEKLHGNALLGAAAAFAGVVLILAGGGGVTMNLSGSLFALLAALFWAIYSNLLNKMNGRYSSLEVSRKVMFYGVITAIPFLLRSGLPELSLLAMPRNALNFLFMGAVSSGVCYFLWNRVMTKIGTVTTNNYMYVSPFVTAISGWVLLGEPMTVLGIFGSVLIVIGLMLTRRAPRDRSKSHHHHHHGGRRKHA